MNTYNDFSIDFLLSLKNYVIEKQLKYFDYTSFCEYIDNECVNKIQSKHKNLNIKLFGISLFKIKYNKKNNKLKLIILSFIPLLKIKYGINKKYYLLNFIPFLIIKKN